MKKRLYKIEQGKKLDGVCGGIAEYFDIDPTLVRIAWIFLLHVLVVEYLLILLLP